jgi:hypothetical protein
MGWADVCHECRSRHHFQPLRFSGMTRRMMAMAVCGMLALAAGACTGGGGSARAPQSHREHMTRTAAGVGRPQAASLMLPAGRSSARYRITAPSPAQYGFKVTVIAPAAASVSVNARTWYGAVLSILISTRDLREWCRRLGSQDICFERFPLLPAQRAGTWTIVASKHSEPAAVVRIAIMFARP